MPSPYSVDARPANDRRPRRERDEVQRDQYWHEQAARRGAGGRCGGRGHRDDGGARGCPGARGRAAGRREGPRPRPGPSAAGQVLRRSSGDRRPRGVPLPDRGSGAGRRRPLRRDLPAESGPGSARRRSAPDARRRRPGLDPHTPGGCRRARSALRRAARDPGRARWPGQRGRARCPGQPGRDGLRPGPGSGREIGPADGDRDHADRHRRDRQQASAKVRPPGRSGAHPARRTRPGRGTGNFQPRPPRGRRSARARCRAPAGRRPGCERNPGDAHPA